MRPLSRGHGHPERPRSRTPGRHAPGSRWQIGSQRDGRPGSLLRGAATPSFELAPDRDPIAILLPRRPTASPSSCPCATSGWPRRPLRLLPRHARRSWPPTSRRRPRTDIIVQASGDAHLSNFGLFASPERTLVFDANDFDETLPGPWEWDVKRLAASVVIAGRSERVHGAARTARRRWRPSAAIASGWPGYAGMRLLDVWYDARSPRPTSVTPPGATGPHEGRQRQEAPPGRRGDLQQGPQAGPAACLRAS